MIFNCVMVLLGMFLSFMVFFAYDTYIDNTELKKEIEKLKKLRKDKDNE